MPEMEAANGALIVDIASITHSIYKHKTGSTLSSIIHVEYKEARCSCEIPRLIENMIEMSSNAFTLEHSRKPQTRCHLGLRYHRVAIVRCLADDELAELESVSRWSILLVLERLT